ncbi:PBP/GOBP family [Nesidiocoris tenuis]|uniref:PBP/GOBP family n=1 Tax=Nesidiocoris tenuis TaxID=355587 RepID=A0ABN7BCG1_9HEMI|nr:PBP/GOBP family [Nesidiocoris tenuis]
MSTFGFIAIALAGIALVHSAATNTFHDRIKAAKAACIEKGGDAEEFKQLWKTHKIPETEAGKCFLGCIMKEMGVLVDGKFDIEKLNSDVPEKWSDDESREKAMKLNKDCVQASTEGKDDCDLATKFASCFVTESDKVGLKPPGHVESD